MPFLPIESEVVSVWVQVLVVLFAQSVREVMMCNTQALRQLQNTGYIAALLLVSCSGCGGENTAVNSASNVDSNAASEDIIKTLLSAQPPYVKNMNRMQINYGFSTVSPEAPMLSLYSAVKKNSGINRFRIVWDLSIVNHHSKRVVEYDRRTKMLWYRWQGRNHEHIINERAVFVGVTPDMIRQATVTSINSGKDNVFTTLPDYGCKRIIPS